MRSAEIVGAEFDRNKFEATISDETALVLIMNAEAIALLDAIRNPHTGIYHSSLVSLLNKVSAIYHKHDYKKKATELLTQISEIKTGSLFKLSYEDMKKAEPVHQLASLFRMNWDRSRPQEISIPYLSKQPIPVADALMMLVIAIAGPNTESVLRNETVLMVQSNEYVRECGQWVLTSNHKYQSVKSEPLLSTLNRGISLSFTYTANMGTSQTGLSFNKNQTKPENNSCYDDLYNDKRASPEFEDRSYKSIL